MLPWNDPLLIDPALYFATGGSVVAALLLASEYFAPGWTGRLAAAVASLLVVAGAVAAAWGQHWEFVGPCVLLSGASALVLFVRSNAFHKSFQFVARPAVICGLLLMVSLLAARCVQTAANTADEPFDSSAFEITQSHAIEGLVALTDQGRALPLIAYDDNPALADTERALLATELYQRQIIRLNEPSPTCNCHGWIYTAGRFAIQSRYIDELLSDNRYTEVAQPQAGDLVIYRGLTQTVEHTGLVRLIDDKGLVLIESKWGPLGVYLHPVASQPYGVKHQFFRSSRAGHLVTIVPESSVSAFKPLILAAALERTPADLDATFSASRGRPGLRHIYERPTLRVPGQRKT